MPKEEVEELATLFKREGKSEVLPDMRQLLREDTCSICRDDGRDKGTVCVVRDPRDVISMERMRVTAEFIMFCTALFLP